MNLHNCVRGAITSVHPDEMVTIARNSGQSVDDAGMITPSYFSLQAKAQVQSESDSALFNANMAGQNTKTKRIYLYAGNSALTQTMGIFRPLARGGDLIRRFDGTWWLVTAVVEDFSNVGWVCVRATLQVKPPQGWIDPVADSEGDDD